MPDPQLDDTDPSLVLVAELTSEMDLDGATEAGLAPQGSAEHAVTHMDRAELRELRQLLMQHQQEFVATVTTKLLMYSLGRGVDYYDMPAVRSIVHRSAESGYKLSALILGVVQSDPFQKKMKGGKL